jgi:uncharacterized membrane protein
MVNYLRQRWIKYGLLWGLGMLLVMEILYPLFTGAGIETGVLLVGKSVIWLACGILFGYILKVTKSIKN